MVRPKLIFSTLLLLLFIQFSISAQQADPTKDQDVLAAVKQNGKWGYADRSGKLVIPALFDDAGGFSEGLAPVKLQKTWGYIGKDGKFKLNPVFVSAHNFHDGRALIDFKDPKDSEIVSGYITHKGDLLILLQFNEVGYEFNDGLARIRLGMGGNQVFGFKDTFGNYKIQTRYDFALDFSEGVAAATFGDKWGFMDENEKIIVPPIYDEVMPFHDGFAWTQSGHLKNFINKSGKAVFPAMHGDVDYMVHEGMVGFKLNGKMGFIDTAGNEVIAPKYDNPTPSFFTEGRAPAAIKKGANLKWGFIDKKGKLVVEAKFDEVRPFSFGLAAVKENGKYGFIDYNGNWVIKPQFEDVVGFTAYY